MIFIYGVIAIDQPEIVEGTKAWVCVGQHYET